MTITTAASTVTDVVEQQTFTCTASAGSFVATFRGSRVSIPFDATMNDLEFTLLESLDTIDDVEIVTAAATVCDGTLITVLFTSEKGALPLLAFDGALLTGAGLSGVTADRTVAGVTSFREETQLIRCRAASGTFKLAFRGQETTITATDDIASLTTSLKSLSSIGDIHVTGWHDSVEFAGIQGGVAGTIETSAAGANSAIFTIHNTGTGVYTFTVTTAGSAYDQSTGGGETIVVLGSLLGGVDVTNDATLTVTGAAGPAALSAANVAITGTPAAVVPFVQTTACLDAADTTGGGILVSFITERGDVDAMVVADVNLVASAGLTASVDVVEIVSGVHPVWGDIKLSYGGVTETTLAGDSFLGEETATVRFDASAAEMKAALEFLMPIGVVSVTRDAIGTIPCTFELANRTTTTAMGVTNSWTVVYDGNAFPFNHGQLKAMRASAASLLYSDVGQSPPTVAVASTMVGTVGNTLKDGNDLDLIAVTLTHRTACNASGQAGHLVDVCHSIGTQENQTMVCKADNGVVAITLGVTSKTTMLNASSTPAQLQHALVCTLGLTGAQVMNASDATICSSLGNGATTTIVISTTSGNIPLLKADTSALKVDTAEAGSVVFNELVKGGVSIKYDGAATGIYTVSYTPTLKGAYDVKVTIQGLDVGTDLSKGVVVAPAIARALESSHNAQPLAVEGVTETFTIQAKDRFLNELDSSIVSPIIVLREPHPRQGARLRWGALRDQRRLERLPKRDGMPVGHGDARRRACQRHTDEAEQQRPVRRRLRTGGLWFLHAPCGAPHGGRPSRVVLHARRSHLDHRRRLGFLPRQREPRLELLPRDERACAVRWSLHRARPRMRRDAPRRQCRFHVGLGLAAPRDARRSRAFLRQVGRLYRRPDQRLVHVLHRRLRRRTPHDQRQGCDRHVGDVGVVGDEVSRRCAHRGRLLRHQA